MKHYQLKLKQTIFQLKLQQTIFQLKLKQTIFLELWKSACVQWPMLTLACSLAHTSINIEMYHAQGCWIPYTVYNVRYMKVHLYWSQWVLKSKRLQKVIQYTLRIIFAFKYKTHSWDYSTRSRLVWYKLRGECEELLNKEAQNLFLFAFTPQNRTASTDVRHNCIRLKWLM